MDSLQHFGLLWSRISKKTTWGLNVSSGFALSQLQQLYHRVTPELYSVHTQRMFWIGRDPQEPSSLALKWMAWFPCVGSLIWHFEIVCFNMGWLKRGFKSQNNNAEWHLSGKWGLSRVLLVSLSIWMNQTTDLVLPGSDGFCSAFMLRVGWWESNYPSFLNLLKGVIMSVMSPSDLPVLISENRNSSGVLQALLQRHFVSCL